MRKHQIKFLKLVLLERILLSELGRGLRPLKIALKTVNGETTYEISKVNIEI